MNVHNHNHYYQESRMSNRACRRRKYGLIHFLGDMLGLLIFNIFWLAWIIVRESRR